MQTSITHDYVEKSKAKLPHTWNIEFSFLLSLFEHSKTLYFLSLSSTKVGPFRPNIYYSRDSISIKKTVAKGVKFPTPVQEFSLVLALFEPTWVF